MLKVPRSEYPDAALLRRLHNEVSLFNSGSAACAPLVEVRSVARGPALILARAGGNLLEDIITSLRENPARSLRVALSLARMIAEFHRSGHMHRALNPKSILVNETNPGAHLIDLVHATRASRLNREIERSTQIPLNYEYMAPEQTGRVNRSVDYRSDLYSLGIIFYRMFAGATPFRADNVSDWAYCHIAMDVPPMPDNVPGPVQSVIRKLLAKNAEDRYQSARGLEYDLKRCLAIVETGERDDFLPGTNDETETLRLPEGVYGRTAESQALFDAFRQAAEGTFQLRFVQGSPGSGKTVLIGELHKAAAAGGGYFAPGKFEQFERNIPYHGWIEVARSLILQALQRNPEFQGRLRSRILEMPGANPGVIAGLVAELEPLLGPQEMPAELPPQEARNRFIAAFLAFVTAFAEPHSPVVIFLDDFQWMDPDSAELLRALLASDQPEYIALVVASREGDAFGSSALLEEMKHHPHFRTIRLSPLQPGDVTHLLADALRLPLDSVRPLAQKLHLQSGGNPLHIMQLLQTMYADGHLWFDRAQAAWAWDETKLASEIGDISAILRERFARLSDAARRSLCAAACLNHAFDEALIAASVGSAEDALRGVQELLNEGLLTAFDGQQIVFEFAHDRIHQAAADSCDSALKDEVHFRAARFLLAIARQSTRSNPYLFSLVDHLEASERLIQNPEERLHAAKACLAAVHRAEANAAWSTVQHAAHTGLKFLPEGSWQSEYDLTWQLHRAAMSADYLNGNYERAESLFRSLNRATSDSLRLARVYEQLVTLYTNTGRHEESIDLALAGLAQLGVKMPRRPGKLRVVSSLIEVKLALRGRKPEQIVELPRMDNDQLLAAMDLMMAVTPSAFFTNQNLFAVIALRMTALSLKHGNSRVSAYGYITYAILLLDVLKDIDGAVRFARAAIALNENIDYAGIRAKIEVIFASFINHWSAPLGRSIVLLRNAYRHGLETGDLVYAGYALANRIFAAAVRGEPLEQILKQCEAFLKFTDRTRDLDVEGDFLIARQAALCLRGETSTEHTFSDSRYNEDQHVHRMQSGNPVTLCFYYLLKARVLLLSGDYAQALAYLRDLSRISEPARPLVIGPAALFLEGLALAGQLRSGSISPQDIRQFEKIRGQYRKWAPLAPHFHIRSALLEAEALAHEGSPMALSKYSEAVRGAAAQDDTLTRAIASELAGRFCRRLGAAEAAQRYLGDALYSYKIYGAFARQRQLQAEFPDAVTVDSAQTQITSGEMPSFIRSSIAISGEIVESRLLERVLQEIMIQAGARRAAYVRVQASGPFVEAVGAVSPRLEVTKISSALGESDFPPANLVRHVLSTKETLVISDAGREQDFDLSSVQRPLRSILVTPVQLRGRLLGVIYLENDLATDVFNQQRLEVISVLSAQFAVALENANLYSRMESLVQERTSELANSLDKLREMQSSQDLDYYLTSLLLQPLGGIRTPDSQLRVSTFASQKKKFSYLKWQEQLGGDISIARSLNLQNRRMLAVANADAMGKSLQGAGGALVFGAVFEAFTSRDSHLTPEEWLRSCYSELNRVFRSFSGYMMASAALGLVDEASMTAFVLNADHPPCVLLRSGRSMLVEEIPAPRLGLGASGETLPHISKMTMQGGDVLVFATDGRDDVLVEAPDGSLTLNDNPDIFPEIVNQAGGDPETICRILAAGDRLTDDLSVISVQFPDDRVSTASNTASAHV